MSNFLGAPIGSAITGAVAILIGIFVFGLLGWFEEPTVWSYVLGALAGSSVATSEASSVNGARTADVDADRRQQQPRGSLP
jgi:hypothetical protein